MKKNLLFLLLTLMASAAAHSQTNLYKQMVGLQGITASCIENYPVGDSIHVSITMLEFSDTASFSNMVQLLKSEVHNQDSMFRSKMVRRMLRQTLWPDVYDDRSSSSLVDRFPSVKTLTMQIFLGRLKSENPNLCLVYCVREWQTILVFHCRNQVELEQVVSYTYSLVLESVKAISKQIDFI